MERREFIAGELEPHIRQILEGMLGCRVGDTGTIAITVWKEPELSESTEATDPGTRLD
jgi:hypothetical protein